MNVSAAPGAVEAASAEGTNHGEWANEYARSKASRHFSTNDCMPANLIVEHDE
eukprot:CAMPEP_0169365544 /NCGR_PEP_ID=MMETSP1017-20121227/32614_1 /TAXON_ID=342587 /ORGANISM="Karlodinium micrum, Strain CCMP2283" /LENGTH=52 /DNA_ID=CAMNT_0009463369 /DNA_START=396 /DNA_END=554 /DNA_ORIENTATION=-